MKKEYKMPIVIDPYESYIHNEFKVVPTMQLNYQKEQKYDKLFDFFYYLRYGDENGIS